MKVAKPGNRLANALSKPTEENPQGEVHGLAGRPKKTAVVAKSVDDLKDIYKKKFGQKKSGF